MVPNLRQALDNSVIVTPKYKDPYTNIGSQSSSATFFNQIIQANSEIEPWNGNLRLRDAQLREFFLTESILKAALFSIASARAAFSWKLQGPPKTVSMFQKILKNSDKHSGWQSLMIKVSIDTLTQDNGGFIEIVRKDNKQNSPVVRLNHLDSAKCTRTGDPENPVIYTDANGEKHLMPWYSVAIFADMPHPDESLYGRQICFLSRVLEGAQIIRDVRIHKHEKVSGRFAKAIHLVGGAKKSEIEDVKQNAQLQADNMGLQRYIEPIILASLDPTATVSHVQIDLASLPEGYDEAETLKWYIVEIAMAAGGDFQDFAPLMFGNLGTSQQSEILHRKARAKGHSLWMKSWEHILNSKNIIPKSTRFQFEQIDSMAELEEAQLKKTRAETRAIDLRDGVVTPEVARQQAADDGDLREEYLAYMGESDITNDVVLEDDGVLLPADINPPTPRRIQIIGEELNTPISPTIIEDEADLPPRRTAAKILKMLVKNSAINQISEIEESQLDLFEIYLEKSFGEFGSISTKNIYSQPMNQIAIAAKKSNIDIFNIYRRLPKNIEIRYNTSGVSVFHKNTPKLVIYPTKNKNKDIIFKSKKHSECTIISTPEFNSQKSIFKPIYFCCLCDKRLSKPSVIYDFRLGWNTVCENCKKDYHVNGIMSVKQYISEKSINTSFKNLTTNYISGKITRPQFLKRASLLFLNSLNLLLNNKKEEITKVHKNIMFLVDISSTYDDDFFNLIEYSLKLSKIKEVKLANGSPTY